MRADYAAGRESRFRRIRHGLAPLGSGADYHTRNDPRFLQAVEYARDMERNDAIAGPLVDSAVNQTIAGGFTPDWNTGDAELNALLLEDWREWAEDASVCDAAGESTFADMEDLTFRRTLVDGDIFVLPLRDGSLQLIESHRCRTPSNTKRNVVNGVLLDQRRRRLEYWMTRDEVDPHRQLTRVGDIKPITARNSDGVRQVLHICNRKRPSQTRGITSFAPVFDLAGQFEDIQLAKVVQAQIVSCIAFIRKRDPKAIGPGSGPIGQESVDHLERLITEIAPGIEITPPPGETVEGFSPNVPNSEFFQHAKFMLQLLGINFGVPLVLLTMDASETNFSGWRGSLDAARMGFRRNQQRMIRQFHRPVLLWRMRRRLRESNRITEWFEAKGIDPELYLGNRSEQAIRDTGINPFAHRWNVPRYPYIQPLQDAQADSLRIERKLISPRRLHAERGQDYDEIISEIVQDNDQAIRGALTAYEQVIEQFGDLITDGGQTLNWREFLNLSYAAPISIATADPSGAAAKKEPSSE